MCQTLGTPYRRSASSTSTLAASAAASDAVAMFGAPNEAHVQRLIGDRPVYTRTTDRKGRALFAAKSIPKVCPGGEDGTFRAQRSVIRAQ